MNKNRVTWALHFTWLEGYMWNKRLLIGQSIVKIVKIGSIFNFTPHKKLSLRNQILLCDIKKSLNLKSI